MTKIIGHRGAAGLALENTKPSITAALALPLDGIELDVRLTKDGKLIVMHDAHTGRLAKERRFIFDSSLADLQSLTLINGEHLLSLDEALQLIGSRMPVTIDVKDRGVSQELARTLARHQDCAVTVSSREYAELARFHALRPDVPFLAQSHMSPTEAVHHAHKLGAIGVSLNKWLMNPLTYHLCKRTNLEIRLYTVDTMWEAKLLTALYPAATLYTNHPERLLPLIKDTK